MVKKRIIVLLAIVLILGLSFLAIQCEPERAGSKLPAKGFSPGAAEQFKSPLKGVY